LELDDRRIFVAGATGVLGVRLVARLVEAGHTVAAMTRSLEKAAGIRKLGAEPVVCDVYDRSALEHAVSAFGPDTVIDELSDLPDDVALLSSHLEASTRMRREGSRNLLGAARDAGVSRLLAQSVAWPVEGEAGAAFEEHERTVLAAGGVVLRYGRLYGPDTYYQDELPSPPRIHVDEAARRTVEALDATSGVLTLVEGDSPGPE
jgi:nucleoside-diphosphate-sugar epimerase